MLLRAAMVAVVVVTTMGCGGTGPVKCETSAQCSGGQLCIANQCQSADAGVALHDGGSGVRGDFDGDGLSDLVFQDAAFNILVWTLHLDNSTVTTNLQLAVDPPSSVGGWRVAATPDWNRDGWPDFAFQNVVSDRVVYWTMHGNKRTAGDFVSPMVPAAGLVAGSGDLNRDGWHDLVFAADPATSPDGGVTVVPFTQFTAASPLPLAPAWPLALNNRLSVVCDVTGDSAPDVLWQNTTSGRISVWALQGVTRTLGYLLPEDIADAGWALRACADFDKNGVADLGFQKVDTNEVKLVMLSDAGAVLSTTRVDPLAGYELVGPR